MSHRLLELAVTCVDGNLRLVCVAADSSRFRLLVLQAGASTQGYALRDMASHTLAEVIRMIASVLFSLLARVRPVRCLHLRLALRLCWLRDSVALAVQWFIGRSGTRISFFGCTTIENVLCIIWMTVP